MSAKVNLQGGQSSQPYDNSASKSKRCKAYSVVIELEIQRVTCPGVWLCNNGKVTIQIFLLGLCTQTSAMNPTFPLLCNEKFIFRKNYANIQNLIDIDRKLDREIIYMELIQWEDCSNGNVLATFKTTLNDLLYPFPCYKGVIAGVDVDLLMEATRIFPGILAPKIEVSTKLTIEEVLCSVKQEKSNDVIVINPKLISSKCVPKRCIPLHQKRVCHNNKYHTRKSSPQSVCCKRRSVRPMKGSLSSQKICTCLEDKTLTQINLKTSPYRNLKQTKCACYSDDISCNVCKRYRNYFADETPQPMSPKIICEGEPTTVMQFKVCKCANLSKTKQQSSRKEPEKEKNYKCKRITTEKPSSGREITCENDKKSVCVCKNCTCTSNEKKSPQRARTKSPPRTPIKSPTKSPPKTPPKTPSRTPPKTPSKTPSKVPSQTLTKPSQKPQLHEKNKRHDLPRASSTPLPPKEYFACHSSCNQVFYRNLENFYRQLYLRAHHKLKNELCKCEGEK